MKKSLVKKLQEIAAGLPMVRVQINVTVTGAALLEKGIKEVEGQRVKSKRKYSEIKTETVNHLNKLKAAHKLSGERGVELYIKQAHQQGRAQLVKKSSSPIESL